MNWAHLPAPGGIYGQHPKLLDEWFVLLHLEAEHEKRKQAEEEKRRGHQRPPPTH